MRTKLTILFSFLSLAASAQLPLDTAAYSHPVITVTNKHYITNWSQFGQFDTSVVAAGTNLGAGYVNKRGTAAHHLVLVNDGGVAYTGAVEFDDCRYIDILGFGSADPFGFIMNTIPTNGFAFPWNGKASNITLMGMIINGGKDEGVTSKLAREDLQYKYKCDMTYAPWVMHDLTIKFCKFRFNGGESWYVNSTGWYGRDFPTCPINDTAIGNLGFDAGHNPTIDLSHTLINTTSRTRNFTSWNVSNSNTIAVTIHRNSGTVAGTITFAGSNDSSSYTTLNTVSMTDVADNTYTRTYSGWNYYRITVATSGTMSIKETSNYTWGLLATEYYNIVCDSNIFIAPGRSSVNFSKVRNGRFVGNKSWHCGRELNTAQGKMFATGGIDSAYVTHNKSFGSFHSAFDFRGWGYVVFENNYWDSSGYYASTANVENNPGVLFGVEVNPPRNAYPVTWQICDNAGYRAKNNIEYGIYPGPQMTTTNNYFGNNIGTAAIDPKYKWTYSTTCPTGTPNDPPTVDAGNDTTITQPATTINLVGISSDADGSIASTLWSNSDGCIIASPSSASTTATCAAVGDHVFTFSVSDNDGATSLDSKIATVLPASNTAPVAIAAPDTIIQMPQDSVILLQSGTDADGTIASYTSRIISSYFNPTLARKNTDHPTLKNYIAGDTIKIGLIVVDDDGTASAEDTTIVIILASAVNNPPYPRIDKDTTLSIQEPTGQIAISAQSSYDIDPGDYVAAYLWQQTSGAPVTIINATGSVMVIDGMTAGEYDFSLTVTDSHGSEAVLSFRITVKMVTKYKVIKNKTRS